MTPVGVRLATAVVLVSVVVGCSSIPAFGPDAKAIERVKPAGRVKDGADLLPFQTIDLTAATLPTASVSFGAFPAVFRNQELRARDEVVEIGDQLEIRIWEVAADGLFSTTDNRETVFNVHVSNSGNITVPYAGAINARGLTASDLRKVLIDRYKGKAVSPEIAVAITKAEMRAANVLGDVGTSGRFAVSSRGVRLLDLLAEAGGTTKPSWEIMVHVQRGRTSGSLPLASIIGDIANNIVIFPGDTIHVEYHPRRFAVYGGVSRPSNIEIPFEDANLAYLLAEVGGLNDRVAQSRSVFVFRRNAANGHAIAYRFDFSRPDVLLLADAFRLQAGDITYVASADAADFQRFISIILSPLLGAATKTSNFGN